MPDWPSLADPPPSMVYPAGAADPANIKWLPRTDFPQAWIRSSPAGRPVAIVELRGWLTVQGWNAEPDWHYELELDVNWMRAKGIDPAALCRPGDVLINVPADPHIARQQAIPATVHIELDGWPRHDSRGEAAKPDTWTLKLPDQCPGLPDTVWPYDPRFGRDWRDGKNGMASVELATGQYVSVWGSLVTDEPHDRSDQIATNMVLRSGVDATIGALGMARATSGAIMAARWIWDEQLPETAANLPARWNEIHSPDYFAVIDPGSDPAWPVSEIAAGPRLSPGTAGSTAKLWAVCVCAQNGLFSGDTQTFRAELTAPPGHPGAELRCTRIQTPWTRLASVVSGPTITIGSDSATVDVSVRGDAGMGASGKYYELFIVEWVTKPSKEGKEKEKEKEHDKTSIQDKLSQIDKVAQAEKTTDNPILAAPSVALTADESISSLPRTGVGSTFISPHERPPVGSP